MKTFLTIVILIIVVVGIYFIYQSVNKSDSTVPEGEEMMEGGTGYIDVSVQEAKEMIDSNSNLVVIDVSPNYAQGHLPGAVNYYVGDGTLDREIPMLDNNKDYLVYCHVDSAAISGAQKMVEAGFDPVYRLEGNYAAWVDAGYPVEK